MSDPSPVDRPAQIVRAALRLLADTPLDQLSTRQIAAEVGISQPALFRHFPTRAHLLAGAVGEARRRLEGVAAEVLAHPGGPLDRIEALARALFAFAEDQPWLPRLLFHDVGAAPADAQRAALRHLVSMQRALVAELVRGAQAGGGLPAALDAEAAGAAFVALLQGALLQRGMARPEPGPLGPEAVFATWAAAARAGQPARGAAPTASAPALGPAAALLDVRPLIRSGVDPLQQILAAVQALPADGALAIRAPFRPRPLLALLASKGLGVTAEAIEDTPDWLVLVRGPGAPACADLRELEAPEPLEQVLLGVGALPVGGALLALTPRVPRLLLDRLAARPVQVCAVPLDEAGALLHVRRTP